MNSAFDRAASTSRRGFVGVVGGLGLCVACRGASLAARDDAPAPRALVPAPPPPPMLESTARPAPTPMPVAGQLLARPSSPTADGHPPGTHRLHLTASRDAYLHVPAGARRGQPAPLVVLLHGAGGDADGGLSLLRGQADRAGLLLLAVASRGRTWDMILGGYGPDVEVLDRALAVTFARHAIDPTRLALAGFSDGASYALSIGLVNGDLFTDVIAFSPGYMAPSRLEGRPRVFISHGVADRVLPIDACSRRLVPRLRAADYDVTYREFSDGHSVPAGLRRDAVRWLTAGRDQPTGAAASDD